MANAAQMCHLLGPQPTSGRMLSLPIVTLASFCRLQRERDATVVEGRKGKFAEKVGMKDPSEQLEAVHDPRPRSREKSTGIDKINCPATRCGKRIETRKALEQLEVDACPRDVISAQRQDHDVGLGLKHVLPGDLHGTAMLSA